MSSFIGPLGGLVSFKCPVTRVQSDRESREYITTSGVRRMHVGRRAHREWRVDWRTVTPSEIANLAALAAGEFGIGPFWFVDPWAQVTNLLHPRASTLELPPFADPPNGMTISGPVDLADGSRAGRSWVPSVPESFRAVTYLDGALHLVPVRNGQTITASMYASGTTVDVRVQWFDSSGAAVGVSGSTSHNPGSQMQRVWHFANPPVGAHAATIQVRGATRVARPALTWTTFMSEWHVGQGAPNVVLPLDFSQGVILATRERRSYGRQASASATIREVG